MDKTILIFITILIISLIMLSVLDRTIKDFVDYYEMVYEKVKIILENPREKFERGWEVKTEKELMKFEIEKVRRRNEFRNII